MVIVRKAAVQFLLALFVLNTTICACAAAVSENAHAHHQSTEVDSRSDCHDGVCLGNCGQAVAAKPDAVAALATVVRLEVELAFLDPVALIVAKPLVVMNVTGPPFHQYLIRTDTPITRKDRLLA